LGKQKIGLIMFLKITDEVYLLSWWCSSFAYELDHHELDVCSFFKRRGGCKRHFDSQL